MSKAERNRYIDFTKFICMIGVIIIHCSFKTNYGLMIKNIFAFATPLFFVWSGYFSNECGTEKIKKRIKRMFIVLIEANVFYAIWDFIYLYLNNENVFDFFSDALSIKRFIILLFLNESPFRGHLWFIGALLNCYLFIYLFDRVMMSNRVALVLSISLLIIGIVLQQFMVINGMQDKMAIYVRNWVFVGLPYFLLGFFVYSLRGFRKIDRKKFILLCVILLVLNILEIVIVGFGRVYYLSTILLVVSISLGYQNHSSNYSEIIKLLCKLSDKCGLLVYIIQVAVIKTYDLFVMRLFGEINNSFYLCFRPIIIIIMVIGISVSIYKFKMCLFQYKYNR